MLYRIVFEDDRNICLSRPYTIVPWWLRDLLHLFLKEIIRRLLWFHEVSKRMNSSTFVKLLLFCVVGLLTMGLIKGQARRGISSWEGLVSGSLVYFRVLGVFLLYLQADQSYPILTWSIKKSWNILRFSWIIGSDT